MTAIVRPRLGLLYGPWLLLYDSLSPTSIRPTSVFLKADFRSGFEHRMICTNVLWIRNWRTLLHMRRTGAAVHSSDGSTFLRYSCIVLYSTDIVLVTVSVLLLCMCGTYETTHSDPVAASRQCRCILSMNVH